MKKFDPIREINRFKKTDPSRWPEMLSKYDRETLQDLTGLLMVSNFYVAETLPEVMKIVNLTGVIKGI
jgi:hypothetical protein